MSRLYNLVSFLLFFKKKMSYFCNCSAARHHQRHPCVYPSFRELSDCIRAICNLKKNQSSHTFAIITTLWISAGWVTCLDFEETCTASSPGTWMSPTHQYPSLLLQFCGLAGGEVILVYLRHVFSYDIFKEPKVIWAVSKIRQQFWEMSQCGSWKRHKGPKAHWINGKMCNNLIWWSTGQWDSQKLKPLMHEPCSKDSLDAIKVNWG